MGLPEPGIKLELRHPCPMLAVMSRRHPLALPTPIRW